MAYESYAREAREPHTPVGRVRREKNIFSVSPQSHSPFSASFQTFCLTARAYLNTQKYGLFCSLVFSLHDILTHYLHALCCSLQYMEPTCTMLFISLL